MKPAPDPTPDPPAKARSGRATINDVAALAGVSVAAVSKVVNGRGGISAATSERILDAVAQLKWAPSAAAVALRGARSRTIGLVLRREPDLLAEDPHFAAVISGVESVLSPRSFGLQLYLVGETGESEAEVYRRLAEQRRVDGALLTESRVGDPRFQLLRDLQLPAVLIGTPERADPVPAIAAEHQDRGVAEAAQHLYGLGHRRIAYVSGPQDRIHVRYRTEVLTRELQRLGVTLGRVIPSGFGGDDAAAATIDLLSGLPADERPTAIAYANDIMAIAGMSTVARMGLSVPGDVSIVGYDDLPLGQWVHPRLTSIGQDPPGLGAAAATELLRLLGESPLAGVIVRPPELVIRQSTGPAPG